MTLLPNTMDKDQELDYFLPKPLPGRPEETAIPEALIFGIKNRLRDGEKLLTAFIRKEGLSLFNFIMPEELLILT